MLCQKENGGERKWQRKSRMGNREKDQNENWPKREGKRKTGGQDEGKEKRDGKENQGEFRVRGIL